MKERPIIMSAESILALLDKRKSQTRRVINPQPPEDNFGVGTSFFSPDPDEWEYRFRTEQGPAMKMFKCPYGAPGDRLWVKETWKFLSVGPRHFYGDPFSCLWQYKADDRTCHGPVLKDKLPKQFSGNKWRSPLFMFRWASRITLEILNVRVERLGDIDNEGALAEGVDFAGYVETVLLLGEHGQPAMSKVIFDFAKVWNSINEKRGYPWSSNPWVWVLEFRTVEVLDGNDFINRRVS